MTSALVKLSEISKSFAGVSVLEGINLELRPGSVHALLGENGAGKSTTFNMVNGQLRADTGSIRLEGREMIGLKPREIWHRGVGRTFQIAETFSSLTVVENVQMALISHEGGSWRLLGRADGRHREAADALLAQVGMTGQAERACGVLA